MVAGGDGDRELHSQVEPVEHLPGEQFPPHAELLGDREVGAPGGGEVAALADVPLEDVPSPHEENVGADLARVEQLQPSGDAGLVGGEEPGDRGGCAALVNLAELEVTGEDEVRGVAARGWGGGVGDGLPDEVEQVREG